MKRLGALGAVIALTLSTGTALATPGSGVTVVNLARGTSAAAYHITASAGNQVATQTNTVVPGGTSGWHTHPGPVVTIVQSGTLSLWYSDACARMTLTAGQAIVVPGAGMYDLGRNEGTTPLVLVQTFFDAPMGAPLRTDAPARQCTGSPDVPVDGTTASGFSGVLHTRVTVAAAVDITGAAGTDLAIQQLTWGEGATTGWHQHPGQVAVLINSNELTYVHFDCTQVPYPAGTGFIDPGVMTHKATNDGNGPVVTYATFANVPVGGATRIDADGPPGDCGQNGQSGANEANGDNNNGGSDGGTDG